VALKQADVGLAATNRLGRRLDTAKAGGGAGFAAEVEIREAHLHGGDLGV
jgi:hypothetical protein